MRKRDFNNHISADPSSHQTFSPTNASPLSYIYYASYKYGTPLCEGVCKRGGGQLTIKSLKERPWLSRFSPRFALPPQRTVPARLYGTLVQPAPKPPHNCSGASPPLHP